MHTLRHWLPGMLLLVGATASYGQIPTTPPIAPTETIAPAPEPEKWLLKVGLNASHALRNGGYYGRASRL